MIIPPRRDLAVQLDIHVQLVAHTQSHTFIVPTKPCTHTFPIENSHTCTDLLILVNEKLYSLYNVHNLTIVYKSMYTYTHTYSKVSLYVYNACVRLEPYHAHAKHSYIHT